MMRVQLIGAALLARLIGGGADDGPDLDWLLHGPTDADVVDVETPSAPNVRLMAAE